MNAIYNHVCCFEQNYVNVLKINEIYKCIILQPDYDDIEVNERVPTQFPRGKSDKGKDNKKYGTSS